MKIKDIMKLILNENIQFNDKNYIEDTLDLIERVADRTVAAQLAARNTKVLQLQ